MTLLILKTRRLAATATLAVAGGLAASASAQFVSVDNYQPQQASQPGQAPTQQPAVMPQAAYVTPPGATAYGPVATTPVYQPAPQQTQFVPAGAYGAAPTYRPAAQPFGAGAPQFRMAQTLPTPSQAVDATAEAVETIAPVQGTMQGQMQSQSQPYSAPMAADQGVVMHNHTVPHQGHAPTMNYGDAGGCATGDCNQGVSWESYATAAPNCDYSPTCEPVCNVAPARPRRQWFAGLYGLYLERNSPDKAVTAVTVADETAITTPYYPPSTSNFLFTSDAQVDGQWGGEVRFGSTFGGGCGCHQPYAWEIGYWGLNEDEGQATTTIDAPITAGPDPRIYGMMNYAGLEYDRDGAAGGTWAYRPLNDYYDYQMPVENNAPDDIRVLGVRVRERFQIQNIELNFWRFGCPVEVGGVGVGGGRILGSTACGPNACGADSCQPCGRPPRRFFINGLCGVRYLRIDNDWQNAVQFTQVTGGVPDAGEPTNYTGWPEDDDNVLFHDIEVDNQLVGFQLGCSMNWLVGCKWNFFADSNFGVYGNDIDTYQRFFSGGGGDVRFIGDGADAAVRANRQEVSMLGELRAGVGYQISCNCRLTAAYRMIGVNGVALAVGQIKPVPVNSELLTHVNHNDSIILHGLQTGVEWKY